MGALFLLRMTNGAPRSKTTFIAWPMFYALGVHTTIEKQTIAFLCLRKVLRLSCGCEADVCETNRRSNVHNRTHSNNATNTMGKWAPAGVFCITCKLVFVTWLLRGICLNKLCALGRHNRDALAAQFAAPAFTDRKSVV